MNICLIGGGGREHTIAWKLHTSPSVEQIYVLGGSAAMKGVATLVDVDWQDNKRFTAWLKETHIDLVVVGPEAPLVAGVADVARSIGVPVFGPSKGAAQIEGSKSFAKDLMKKYNIPTAAYEVCQTVEAAKAVIDRLGAPIVLKADGLAAGKGVIIAETIEEAYATAEDMLVGHKFGDASIVIEEFMVGEEASLLAFVDGTTVVPMVSAQDHKRIFDGDKGPNTGGMGTYAPAPIMTADRLKEAYDKVLLPTVKAMAEEGHPYVGCLYAGLMVTDQGIKVVEFNARFGDPETQVILPLLKGDLGDIMYKTAVGQLSEATVDWYDGSATCVVLASAGYPESSHKGDIISGDVTTMAEDSFVFHSGTAKEGDHFVTSGGRVLGVVGLAPTLQGAVDKAYQRVETISFDGEQYRKDIAQKGLAHLR